MPDAELARFRKQIPVRGATLGYKLDRREACVSGDWLHTWHMDIEHTERVVRRKLADAASAKRAFRAWIAALQKDRYEVVPATSIGWTINPRGLRGYYDNGAWRSPKRWGAGVEVLVVEDGKAPKSKTVPVPAPIDPNPVALAKLATTRPARGSFVEIVDATNAWFAQLVAAGFPLDDLGWEAPAIRTSGAYKAHPIRAIERALDVKLPPSYVEQLRTIGDVAVLGRSGREATYALEKRRGWPLGGTLVHATRMLDHEIGLHEETGSFTAAEIAKRQWLRIAANAPGGSDHNFIMDLARRDRAGETAIYRVPDIGFPTEIDREATVYGMHAWLVAQVHALHALVIRTSSKRASRRAPPKRRAPSRG